MSDYHNENEIVIHSMGRSGSHAITNWIASMFEEPILFFHHCPLDNPYNKRFRYWNRVKNRPIKKFFIKLPKSFEERGEYRNIHKHCLMYSYEWRDIRILKNADFIKDRDSIIGKSKNRYNVLILRDFFNWLASCLVNFKRGTRSLNFYPKYNISRSDDWTRHASIISERSYRTMKKTKIFKLWKFYAEEFLGKTNYLESTGSLKDAKICISFNQWFVDEKYRREIAKLLDLEYSDFTLKFAGSPSGFDGHKYLHENAQEMKALDRWKTLKDNPIYHEFLDPECVELSHEIFGKEIGDGLLVDG